MGTVTTYEMIHQSDEMIQYLSWPSKAADLICLWRLKLDFNEQYLSVNELTKSCPIFMPLMPFHAIYQPLKFRL